MSLRRELARKLLHVSTAVVPVAYAAGLSRSAVASALGALVTVALVVELARRHRTGARAFTRATGTLLREHEHAGAWAGATWLLLAFLLATLAFPRAIAIAAMLGVSLGDAAGAVVGRWWGARRAARMSATPSLSPSLSPSKSPTESTASHAATSLGGPPREESAPMAESVHHHASARAIDRPADASMTTRAPTPAGVAPDGIAPVGIAPAAKTWAGTIACAVATTLGALLVAHLGPLESTLAGVLAAAAERPVWRFDDNLRIVLAVGAGILLCRLAFS